MTTETVTLRAIESGVTAGSGSDGLTTAQLARQIAATLHDSALVL